MLYSTVEIKPKAFEPGYEVFLSDLDGDRYDDGGGPMAIGFYHYPRDIGDEAAFKSLRECMIEAHRARIASSLRHIEMLGQLTCPVYERAHGVE